MSAQLDWAHSPPTGADHTNFHPLDEHLRQVGGGGEELVERGEEEGGIVEHDEVAGFRRHDDTGLGRRRDLQLVGLLERRLQRLGRGTRGADEQRRSDAGSGWI